jgi:DNA polymerase III, subunits gamma and tau
MSDFMVSARKFRPQKFNEVTSQDFVVQTMRNAIKVNKIAHAYLLSGPRGVGKTTIARIMAKALNCTDPGDGEPCGECGNCTEITKGVHPDVVEMDAASNRGIDDVRAIQDTAKYYPIKGKYKFFIIDEVHMLTLQAFNALLKILEEPPKYLIFILATTNPEKIPQTIVSRCQRFQLQRITINEISDKLNEIAKQEGVNIDERSVFLIAKLGDGALRDALGIFDMAVSFCGNNITFDELRGFLNLPDKEIYFEISNRVISSDAKGIIEYFEEVSSRGFDLMTFYNGVTEHFRNLLLVKTTGSPDLLDESEAVKSMYLESAQKFSEPQLLRLLKVLFEAESRLKYSSNQKLLLEMLLVELTRVNGEISDLISVIEILRGSKKKLDEEITATGISNTHPPNQILLKSLKNYLM